MSFSCKVQRERKKKVRDYSYLNLLFFFCIYFFNSLSLMFNQKPAFKFVIKSKLDVPSTVSDKKETSVSTLPTLDDRKRKRTDGSAPIATKKVLHWINLDGIKQT